MKRVLTLLMAIMIIISNCFVFTYAETNQSFYVYGEDKTAAIGEYVQVPISIENNKGIMGFRITVNYNSEVLTPINVKSGLVTSEGMLDNSIISNVNGTFDVVWTNSSNVNSDGTLFTMSFYVKDTALTETSIQLSYLQDDTFNESWEDVALNCSSVVVNINGTGGSENPPVNPDNPGDDETVIYSEDIFINTNASSDVVVPIKIKNNKGIMGYKLKLEYDEEVVTVTSVRSTGINGNFDNNLENKSGTLTVVWNGTENYCEDGTLFEVDFHINANQSTEILISYSEDDTFNESWDDVRLNCQKISLIFKPEESFNFTDTSTVKAADGVNYVYGFRTSMTEAQFKNGGYFEAENVTVTVQKSSSRYIGTGSVITVTYASGKVEEYIVIIYGDIDGNAKVDTTDAMALADSLTGDSAPLAGAQKLAANVYGTGSRVVINDQDLAGISSVAAGEAEIDQTTGKLV